MFGQLFQCLAITDTEIKNILVGFPGVIRVYGLFGDEVIRAVAGRCGKIRGVNVL